LGIKTLSLESSLCWELRGPDAAVDRGFSTHAKDEEVADGSLVGALDEVFFGDL